MHAPFRRLLKPKDEPQKRGLPRPIWSHEADLVAPGDAEVNIRKNVLGAIVLAQGLSKENRHACNRIREESSRRIIP